ncbi:conserved hypothetical protein [Thermoanaerobacter italicus Ab9]|uniref:Uncharacterized protein n=1 Tax=Thermoanaerobacter italicus (strain DSM 9252 / Ab9) TaxID=580331 RepID=D3T8M4_THEIA|nr:hypothetical protein [Thermoanaerobacter italicus]ADD02306.1 conserved hypothetical protein [Thermoanaerobacter italicus Ab9]
MNRDKYMKGFLAGLVTAAYIIPKINMKKYRRYKDMIEKSVTKICRTMNKIKIR